MFEKCGVRVYTAQESREAGIAIEKDTRFVAVTPTVLVENCDRKAELETVFRTAWRVVCATGVVDGTDDQYMRALLSKIEKYDSYHAVSNQVSSALSRFVWRETVYREARFVGSSARFWGTVPVLHNARKLNEVAVYFLYRESVDAECYIRVDGVRFTARHGSVDVLRNEADGSVNPYISTQTIYLSDRAREHPHLRNHCVLATCSKIDLSDRYNCRLNEFSYAKQAQKSPTKASYISVPLSAIGNWVQFAAAPQSTVTKPKPRVEKRAEETTMYKQILAQGLFADLIEQHSRITSDAIRGDSGIDIEFKAPDGEWVTSWDNLPANYELRLIVNHTEPLDIPWAWIDRSINYVAQDNDLRVFGYPSPPKLCSTEFSSCVYSLLSVDGYAYQESKDWRRSVTVRPGYVEPVYTENECRDD